VVRDCFIEDELWEDANLAETPERDDLFDDYVAR